MSLGSVGLFLFRPVTMADLDRLLRNVGPDWSSAREDESGLQVFYGGEALVVADFGLPDEDGLEAVPDDIIDEVRKAAKSGPIGKGPKPVTLISLIFENRADQLPWQVAFELGRVVSRNLGTAVIHDWRTRCHNMAKH